MGGLGELAPCMLLFMTIHTVGFLAWPKRGWLLTPPSPVYPQMLFSFRTQGFSYPEQPSWPLSSISIKPTPKTQLAPEYLDNICVYILKALHWIAETRNVISGKLKLKAGSQRNIKRGRVYMTIELWTNVRLHPNLSPGTAWLTEVCHRHVSNTLKSVQSF